MTASQGLVTRLVDRLPDLEPLLHEHLREQDGELLPYLLLADVARWAQASFPSEPQLVGDLVVRGDFDVRNLIDVGIVEMLPAAPEGATVLDLLGPELRARAQVAGLFADRY
ncbi:MAG TPA: hypothetical protein VGD39_00370 [Nocardioides sp.]